MRVLDEAGTPLAVGAAVQDGGTVTHIADFDADVDESRVVPMYPVVRVRWLDGTTEDFATHPIIEGDGYNAFVLGEFDVEAIDLRAA